MEWPNLPPRTALPGHTTGPYWGTNDAERIVARVTLAFFGRYVLGQQAALAAMSRYGNVRGTAALVAAGTPVPGG